MRQTNKHWVGWIFLLVAVGLFSGLSACNDEGGIEFNDPDGDLNPQLEGYDDVEMVTLKGGSGTEGNPAIVVVGFALDTVDFDRWSGTRLDLSRLLLERSEGDLDPLEYSTEGSMESVALDRIKPTPVRINAPTDEAFTGIVLSSESDERTMHLTVVYEGQSVNVDLDEGLSFGLQEGITPWVTGTHGYLLYLPLNAWVQHLGGSLENLSDSDIDWLVDRMAIYQDTNKDAELDDEENSQDNRVDEYDGSMDGLPPTPVLQLHQDYADEIDIADLNGIKLDASGSINHLLGDRLPFKYKYRWGSAGKPVYAINSILTCSICDLVNPQDIMDSNSDITDAQGWTDDATPKIFIPVAGVYSFDLKVKDSQGLESGPTSMCPDCEEWTTLDLNIKPTRKIHIELTWDQGGDTDMDLYLIRYRDEGTMGIAYPNALTPQSPPRVSCDTGTPCPDDASENPFTCGDDGFCEWNCTSDDDCRVIPGTVGLTCRGGTCEEMSGSEISCESDEDCGEYYCNVKQYLIEDRICTTYPWEALNDSCNYTNRNPRWTEDPTEMPDSDASTSSYPSLDIDDVTGYGPEVISLKEPLPGRYRIVARLYSAGIVEGGNDPIVTDTNPAKATVNVYLNGDLVLTSGNWTTAQLQFTKANVYWKVADIIWQGSGDDGAGALTLLDTTNDGTDPDDFSSNPYANPFYSPLGSIFDPNKESNPRSIWCDAPTDEYKAGVTCQELYAQ